MTNEWNAYNKLRAQKPPSGLLAEALEYVPTPSGQALDLGAGPLIDSYFLSNKGFVVTAVDSNSDVKLRSTNNKISIVTSSFDKFDFPTQIYTLINSQYALPFNPPGTFDLMFDRLVSSLKIGGVFTGHFFGTDDSWSKSLQMTFHTEEQIKRLLADFDIHVLREEKKEGKTTLGKDKFWHVFHVIATKTR